MAKTTPTKTSRTKVTSNIMTARPPTVAKAGSKADAIIALLGREGGATIKEMMEATDWQNHSVRGFMAGALKKQRGLTVTSKKTEEGRLYRIRAEITT